MQPEALNKKAIQIINRVRDKLTGESSSSPHPQCASGGKLCFFIGGNLFAFGLTMALTEQAEERSFQLYCQSKILKVTAKP